MSDLFFGTSLFEDFDRLQTQMSSLLSGSPSSIRAARAGTFPQINMGVTDDSVEIVAFAPGIDPSKLNVTIEKGLLLISGERRLATRSDNNEQARTYAQETRTYAQERFSGSFRRAIELPRDADPDKVHAQYINGCLKVSVGKRESSKPRAISVQ